ncbi:hypothetical protein AB0K48_48105, partial [Nonomuraea sp. NPDC055795]
MSATALGANASRHRRLKDRRKLGENIAGWSFAGPATLVILGFSLVDASPGGVSGVPAGGSSVGFVPVDVA